MSDVIYALGAIVWLGLLVGYIRQGPRQIARDLRGNVPLEQGVAVRARVRDGSKEQCDLVRLRTAGK